MNGLRRAGIGGVAIAGVLAMAACSSGAASQDSNEVAPPAVSASHSSVPALPSSAPSSVPALPAAPDPGTIVDKVHDNHLHFTKTGAGTMGFAYNNNYAITDNQTFEGVGVSGGQDDELDITVKAGRKKSERVANWFKERNVAAAHTNTATHDEPGELNFAFEGDLVISGHSYPVVLGQGSTGSQNNWWIGGRSGSWEKTGHSGSQGLKTPDGLYKITSENNDRFKIEKA